MSVGKCSADRGGFGGWRSAAVWTLLSVLYVSVLCESLCLSVLCVSVMCESVCVEVFGRQRVRGVAECSGVDTSGGSQEVSTDRYLIAF